MGILWGIFNILMAAGILWTSFVWGMAMFATTRDNSEEVPNSLKMVSRIFMFLMTFIAVLLAILLFRNGCYHLGWQW